MRAGIVVNVTRADRRRLEAIVSDRCAPQKHVWRANIILATADGCGTAEIMRRSGIEARGVAMAGAVYGGGHRRAHARQDAQARQTATSNGHRGEGGRADAGTAARGS